MIKLVKQIDAIRREIDELKEKAQRLGKVFDDFPEHRRDDIRSDIAALIQERETLLIKQRDLVHKLDVELVHGLLKQANLEWVFRKLEYAEVEAGMREDELKKLVTKHKLNGVAVKKYGIDRQSVIDALYERGIALKHPRRRA